MYVTSANHPGLDFGVRSSRRRRSPWLPRAARAAAVLIAVATLALGLARVAEGVGGGPYETLTVEPGDTLWSIAADRYPGADVRTKVFQIEQLNRLEGPAIEAGKRLQVPTR